MAVLTPNVLASPPSLLIAGGDLARDTLAGRVALVTGAGGGIEV